MSYKNHFMESVCWFLYQQPGAGDNTDDPKQVRKYVVMVGHPGMSPVGRYGKLLPPISPSSSVSAYTPPADQDDFMVHIHNMANPTWPPPHIHRIYKFSFV